MAGLKEPQGPIVNALDTLDDTITAIQQCVQALSLKLELVCAEPVVSESVPSLVPPEHSNDTSSAIQQRIRRMNHDLQHQLGVMHVLHDTLEV